MSPERPEGFVEGYAEKRVLPHGWKPMAVGQIIERDGRRCRVTTVSPPRPPTLQEMGIPRGGIGATIFDQVEVFEYVVLDE